MKETFIKGFGIGAITGLGLATVYAIISLIVSEFYLPGYEPSILAVFKSDSFFLPILLGMSIFAILLSSAIGGITSAIFSFILKNFQWQKQNFMLICTFLSTIPSGLYTIAVILFLLSGRYGASHLLIFILDFQLAGIVLLLLPGIIYVVTSAFISRHLYNQFQPSNATSPPP